MIDKNRKIVFAHIAKAAGTSVEKWLGITEDCFGYREHDGSWIQHATMSSIMETYPEYSQCYRFAVVRNPFTRLQSMFRHGRKWGMTDFKRMVMDMPRLTTERTEWGNPDFGGWFTSQYDHTHIDGRLDCEIFKFEELPESLNKIRDMFCLGEMPCLNVHEGPSPSFDDEMIEMVRSVWRKDFEVFGYADTI